MSSVAILKYGTYTFDEVPQVGYKQEYKRAGKSGAGAFRREMVITLEGKVRSTDLHSVRTKYRALEDAFAESGLHLYFYDGSVVDIDNEEATVDVAPESPVEWGQYEQSYRVTLRYAPSGDTPDTRVVKYGSFTFSNYPIVTQASSVSMKGGAATAPAARRKTVTVRGYVTGNTTHDIQAKLDLIEAALKTNRQTLYYNDGSVVVVNAVAQVTGFAPQGAWENGEAAYSATFTYQPLDDVHNLSLAVSYNGFTFTIPPTMSRQYKPQRSSATASAKSQSLRITLQGFFAKGSTAANETEFQLLRTALSSDGHALVYGTFSQTVNVDDISHDADIMDVTLSYAVSFICELPYDVDSVLEMDSTRDVSRPHELTAWHKIPYEDGFRTPQELGGSGQTISIRGSIRATSIAAARTAAATEIAAMTEAGGYELPGGSIHEDPSNCKIGWGATFKYKTPVLTGGVYGSY